MKKINVVYVLVSLLISSALFAQVDTAWTRRWTSAGANGDYVYGLAVDNAGNVFITGGSNYLGSTPELLTVKYNSAGDSIWANVPTRPNTQRASAVAVGASGCSYITGYTMENGNGDYITIKYRPDGTEAWVRVYAHGTGYDFARKLVIDSIENVYVTGYAQVSSKNVDVTLKYDSSGTLLWARQDSFYGVSSIGYPCDLKLDYSGIPYIVARTKNSSGNYDYLVVKYNPLTGDTLWARLFDGAGAGNDEARDVAFDPSGNVYVTGQTVGSGTGNDATTIKYNSSGVQQWSRTYNNSDTVATDAGYWIKYDPSGYVYVYGTSYGINGAYQDLILIKYDAANGNEVWSARYNGPSGPNGTNHVDAPVDKDGQKGMAIDQSGNIYVLGATRQLEGPLTQNTENDFITIKYNSIGDTVWTARYDYADSLETPYAIDVDNQNNVYVTGRSVSRTGSYYDVATIKYVQASGIEEVIGNQKSEIGNFSVYPNPAKAYLTVRIPFSAARSKVKIFDASGKLVKEIRNVQNGQHNDNTIRISLAGIKSGVYFVKLDKETSIRKLIITK